MKRKVLVLVLLAILCITMVYAQVEINYPTDGGTEIDLGKAVKVSASGQVSVCGENDAEVVGLVIQKSGYGGNLFYKIANAGMAIAPLPTTVTAGDKLTTDDAGALRTANSGEVIVGVALENGDGDPDMEGIVVTLRMADPDDFLHAQCDSAQCSNFWIGGMGRIADSLIVEKLARIDSSLFLGFVPDDPTQDSILTIDEGQVKKVATSDLIVGDDGDWTITGFDMYSALSGNVGIGTTSPDAKLDIEHSTGKAIIVNNSGTNRAVDIISTNAGSSSSALYINNQGGGAGLDAGNSGSGTAIVGWSSGTGDLLELASWENPIWVTKFEVSKSGNVDFDGTLKIGDVPDDATHDSVLTIDDGQVKKVAAADLGGDDGDWADSTTFLMVNGQKGIFGYGNVGYGNQDSTHVNLGVACTTGRNGFDDKYITVGGGNENYAGYPSTTVSGGSNNRAYKFWATVGGGTDNASTGTATTISGGRGNDALTDYSTIAGGKDNTVDGYTGTVGGGMGNTANGYTSVVGGGYYNIASSSNATVAGGSNNTAEGINSTVSGGLHNTATGSYSAIGGGWFNTDSADFSFVYGKLNLLRAEADYSVLFGIDDTIAVDSTFYVGLPYTHLEGELEVDSKIIADTISSPLDTLYINEKVWVEELVTDTIESRGNFVFIKDALGVQDSFYFDGVWRTSWPTGGGDDGDWADSTTFLMVNGQKGIFGYGNVGYGVHDSTHVNLGVACTTGASGSNFKYATVSGGLNNIASGANATVGGGYQNTASGVFSTVGGGGLNTASGGVSTVGGGQENTASTDWATVGGGWFNTVSGMYATVGGGVVNTASNERATVGGGQENTASGLSSTVSGGESNTASGGCATVGGGYENSASGYCSAIPGGYADTVSGDFSFAFGQEVNVTSDYTAQFFTKYHMGKLLVGGWVGINTTTPARVLHVKDAMRLEPRVAAPSSPSEGDMYMDSGTHKLMVYDGTVWQACW